MGMEIPIVDQTDTVIGAKKRSALDYSNDIFRTASLWITDGHGNVLIAQRKLDKKVDPGKWGEAVGGTVEGDDTYEDTVRREAAEELGIYDLELHAGPKQFIDSYAKYFVQWYYATLDMPLRDFVIQPEEVEAIAWIPVAQLKEELRSGSHNYIPAMNDIVELHDTPYAP